MDGFQDSPQWRWNWTAMCGPDNFQIWSTRTHDLGLCFTQLCLEIPVLSLLAIISSYYYGKYIDFVSRGRLQLRAIKVRSFIVLMLAFLPLLQVYIDLNTNEQNITQVSYFLSAVQGICWFTHFLFQLGLRKRLGLSCRGPMPVCFLWSFLLVLSAISLRSHYLLYKLLPNPEFKLSLSFGFSFVYFVLQVFYAITLIPSSGGTSFVTFPEGNNQADENTPLLHNAYVRFNEDDQSYLGVAMEDANWFSKLLFYWVNPLMDKGFHLKLTNADDLFDLPLSLNSSYLSAKVNKHLGGQKDERTILTSQDAEGGSSTSSDVTIVRPSSRRNVSLLRALHRSFGVQFYAVGVLKLAADCTAFAGPILLNKLVGFIEDKSEDIGWGYAYAAGLMMATMTSSLCDAHFNFWMSVVGLKMRSALVTVIYRKTLSVSSINLNKDFSVGKIVNFMSTDTDRIVNSCPSFHALWSIPFQLGVTLYLLYDQVGLSFLAGVVFSAVLIPINKVIANKIGELSKELMEQKDARVKMITEVLRGIKAIKLYVWEQHFIRLITKLREEELKYLKGRKYLDALCVVFWASTPVVVSVLTMGTYSLLGNKLTAATVFTCIALLNMLISPLNAFPWVLNGMTEAWVSVKRIQKLLDLPDLNFNQEYNEDLLGQSSGNHDIILSNGGYTWGKELSAEEKLKLHDVRKRKLSRGKGAGKKSAITLDKRNSVESHILEEEDSYIFTLSNINLSIKKGDLVGIIGSVGCGKSSLLSAMLAELSMFQGQMVTTQMESGFGFVTQQPWLQCGTIRENILFGKSFDETKYKTVIYACGLAEDITQLKHADLTDVGEGGMTLSGGQKARIALARAVYQDKSIYLLDDILSAVDVKVARHIFENCIMGVLRDKTRILCTHHVQYLVYADKIVQMENGTIKQQGKPVDVLSNMDDTLPIDLELGESSQSDGYSDSLLSSIKTFDNSQSSNTKDNDLALQETQETGTVALSVYSKYWKALGHILCFCILISITMMQATRNLTDWWLSHWVTEETNRSSNNTNLTFDDTIYIMSSFSDENEPTSYYLRIYVEMAVVNVVFTVFRAFLFAYGGVVAAAKIHKLLLKSIMRGKLIFFDITPLGRILNRFSSDTYTIDDSLPFIMNILLAQFFSLLGCIAITVYGLPWISLVLVPLVPVYHSLQDHYRLTSRELKRISSVTLSPIYSHFNETLQGLTTIRAMRASGRFRRENEDKIEANLKAQFASQCAARWLGLRLQFIGVAIVAGVSFIAVIQHQYDFADPGMVGLAISYALSVTGQLGGVVNAFTETEKEMIAVERVNQYIKEVPSESTELDRHPPFGWPSQGVIVFRDVVLRYRDHLVPSLKQISFEARPCEKIGIVGRTGAGKSSILAALFRLTELSSGMITIDTVNISKLALSGLRSRLFCIPQDPFLFSATIRENLDPLKEFRDAEIWASLIKVNLMAVIQKMGGLDQMIEGAGENLSVGQKQLICLARAVLHNAKILCIDEATASIDIETDRQIQHTLRSAFRKSTVLTIAHRIETILDSDRILVLDDGKIVEFDTPDNLMSTPSSIFSRLIDQDYE
ncbi:unnamed protein product [Brassicogethes aeneus]|uniref:ABC-type xenobiotic transporter n=1 Tax=Brassicogethes aeneus TaxID=1431903 RepID=A0A9P0BE62_BRAAE|nr:unnamed protein product [Brassicogethes aeneus]